MKIKMKRIVKYTGMILLILSLFAGSASATATFIQPSAYFNFQTAPPDISFLGGGFTPYADVTLNIVKPDDTRIRVSTSADNGGAFGFKWDYHTKYMFQYNNSCKTIPGFYSITASDRNGHRASSTWGIAPTAECGSVQPKLTIDVNKNNIVFTLTNKYLYALPWEGYFFVYAENGDFVWGLRTLSTINGVTSIAGNSKTQLVWNKENLQNIKGYSTPSYNHYQYFDTNGKLLPGKYTATFGTSASSVIPWITYESTKFVISK
jgi:hypothetical protein